jgi:hypothetical protein
MLYLMADKILPIESWQGFVAGGLSGAVVLFCFRSKKKYQ